MEDDQLTEEQIDLIGRLVQYTCHRSMNHLRQMIRDEFIDRGWKEKLKHFKVVDNRKGEVVLYTRGPAK